LVQEYKEKVGNNYLSNKKTADGIHSQIKKIDEIYYRVLKEVSDEFYSSSKNKFEKCCAYQSEDPILKLVCNFAKYLSGNESVEYFLGAFPASKIEYDAFWNLQEIAYVIQTTQNLKLPRLFSPSGPCIVYFDQLLILMKAGNRKAFGCFLNLAHHADGVFVEQMGDMMAKLATDNPEILMEQWVLLRKEKKILIDSLLGSLSQVELKKIEKLIKEKYPGKQSKEVLQMLAAVKCHKQGKQ
jgi:hypothetical protein